VKRRRPCILRAPATKRKRLKSKRASERKLLFSSARKKLYPLYK
jgi:hypothetical protein